MGKHIPEKISEKRTKRLKDPEEGAKRATIQALSSFELQQTVGEMNHKYPCQSNEINFSGDGRA
ncbi:hypothetical protein HXX01_03175 [Candidatus Nomurabacteria bacterium]|nr:hypothetical protein [Candidatus Nomurabacteria bacterium]